MFSNDLKTRAVEWTNRVESMYQEQIQSSIARSIIERNYEPPARVNLHKFDKTDVIVENMTSEEAVRKYANYGHVCVLNFASYKSPGGMFMDGSTAQEEALCHASTLYPVLKHFNSEYLSRYGRLNNGLYGEDFIYSPDILFPRDEYNDVVYADVLTYAAPCMRRKAKTREYYDIFSRRMVNAFIYPALQGADIYVIGAYGCGVFMNHPDYVSKMWNALTATGNGIYKTIIHPIPIGNGPSKNYNFFNTNCTFGRVYPNKED